MTRTRLVLGLATVVALVVVTVIAGYGLFAVWFGTCGGDAGLGMVPHESDAGRFCSDDSDLFGIVALVVPVGGVLVGGSCAVVRAKARDLALGVGLAVVVVLAALAYPGTLSTECDHPVQQSEECDTY